MMVSEMLRIEVTGNARKAFADMAKRADDLRPLSSTLSRLVRTEFRRHVSAIDIGDGDRDTGDLVDAMRALGFWRMSRDGFEAAPAIDYAVHYADWRRANGLADLLPASEVAETASRSVLDYITTGRT